MRRAIDIGLANAKPQLFVARAALQACMLGSETRRQIEGVR
jgi:hypothetical protein